MKTKGRPQSKNIVDNTNSTFNGRRNQFVNESLKLGVGNHKPTTKFGSKGTRKSGGYLTGGGF